MRQKQLMLVMASVLTLGLASFVSAQMMGGTQGMMPMGQSDTLSHSATMGAGQMMGSGNSPGVQSEAILAILSKIRRSQNIGPQGKIDSSRVTNDQFEELGDAWMNVMMPDQRKHEAMDQMMGGEGSESLASAHRTMGSHYLSFLQNGTPDNMPNNMMMGGMMGMNGGGMSGMGTGQMPATAQKADGLVSQMSQYCQMMSSDFNNLETHFEKMMKIKDMKTLKAEMQMHHEMMMSMQSDINGQKGMCQNMMSMMQSGNMHGMMMNTDNMQSHSGNKDGHGN